MAHDVFICHSSKDRTIANAICSKLEQNHIRCWIAPRDVLPGRDYAECIIDAISGTRLIVLVFSDNSNQSAHVHREIERAVGHGVAILPFRLEDVAPSPSLEYFISSAHWLDAITPPVEQHLDHLVGTVRLLLDRAGAPATTETAPPPAPSVPAPAPASAGRRDRPWPGARLPSWSRWAALAAAAAVAAVIAGITVAAGGNHGTAPPRASSPSPAATGAAPAGTTAILRTAVSLTGIDAGSQASVTVMKVVDPATVNGDTPAPGSRYVAIQVQIDNTGARVIDDSPDNCANLLDASGIKLDATPVLAVTAGPVFPATIRLRPGHKTMGYTVFEVPKSFKVTRVRFTMDSGYAGDSGQWTV
jgi:hypothetical protein